MTTITPNLLNSLVTQDGTLWIGDPVVDAIESCLVSNPDVIRQVGEQLSTEYDSFENKWEPTVVDYSGPERLDAYCVRFLPRNTLVPKLALLCCAYHPRLRKLGSRIRILDIGSGPGSVVLGLLDLFQNEELSGSQLDIVALDCNDESLERQKKLVRRIGPGGSTVKCHSVDLEDRSTYQRELSSGAPYDMVFAANVLVELSSDAAEAVLQDVAPLLGEKGIIVSVESETNYTKLQRVRVARKALELGLYRYYPCPPDSPCPKQTHPRGCWVWREDNFKCPEIKLGTELLEPTNVQRAHLMILCKKPYSIYNVLEKFNPNLTWGVVESVFQERDGEAEGMVEQDYNVCTHSGMQKIKQRKKKRFLPILFGDIIPRGVFLGYNKDFSRVETWNIL